MTISSNEKTKKFLHSKELMIGNLYEVYTILAQMPNIDISPAHVGMFIKEEVNYIYFLIDKRIVKFRKGLVVFNSIK